jgi:hypothetical protein
MSSNAGAAITAFAMGEPTPNPTPRAFRVEYTVARATKVRLTLLDLQGREVAVLAEGPFSPGRYIASWDGMNNGRQVPTGVYFVRYQAERQQFVRRVVISR